MNTLPPAELRRQALAITRELGNRLQDGAADLETVAAIWAIANHSTEVFCRAAKMTATAPHAQAIARRSKWLPTLRAVSAEDELWLGATAVKNLPLMREYQRPRPRKKYEPAEVKALALLNRMLDYFFDEVVAQVARPSGLETGPNVSERNTQVAPGLRAELLANTDAPQLWANAFVKWLFACDMAEPFGNPESAEGRYFLEKAELMNRKRTEGLRAALRKLAREHLKHLLLHEFTPDV